MATTAILALQEDSWRVRNGIALEVPAALRNVLVQRLWQPGPGVEGLSRREVLRRLGARPTQVLQTLGLAVLPTGPPVIATG